MKGATYKLGKHRKYLCPQCGMSCHRPLSAKDTTARPFPKPCNRCDASLKGAQFVIVDSQMELGRLFR